MISYSGLRNYKNLTLPNVVSYNGSMNIIKDLPKGYMIPIREKVGENSMLTEMIENSASRFCDSISYYPKGINPAVGVMMNNTDGKIQAKLPYRVMKDGAFRPPIIAQSDLVPLSRQKRSAISIDINPVFFDDTKVQKNIIDPKTARQIRKEILSTQYFQSEFPEKEEIYGREYDHSTQIKAIDLDHLNINDISSQKIYIPKNIEYVLETKKFIQEHPSIEIKNNKISNNNGKIQLIDIALSKEVLRKENMNLNKKYLPQTFERKELINNKENINGTIHNIKVIPKNSDFDIKIKNIREKINVRGDNENYNKGNLKHFIY